MKSVNSTQSGSTDKMFNSAKKIMATFIVAMCMVQGMWANTATEIADIIRNASGNQLTATVSGSNVTVTGTIPATLSNADFLRFGINAGTTVIWRASLTGSPSGNFSLINITGGSGTFRIESGIIENTSNGRAITNNSASTITIQGGTIRTGSGTAIHNASTGVITVSGGTVSATTGTAISSYGRITINNGTVSTTSGTTISASGTITISGGTVSSITGTAFQNRGTATVSGSAIITSANSNSNLGNGFGGHTIELNGGTLNINGGTVENTATSNTANNRAIFAFWGNNNTLNISGGTVRSTNGDAIVWWVYLA